MNEKCQKDCKFKDFCELDEECTKRCQVCVKKDGLIFGRSFEQIRKMQNKGETNGNAF